MIRKTVLLTALAAGLALSGNYAFADGNESHTGTESRSEAAHSETSHSESSHEQSKVETSHAESASDSHSDNSSHTESSKDCLGGLVCLDK